MSLIPMLPPCLLSWLCRLAPDRRHIHKDPKFGCRAVILWDTAVSCSYALTCFEADIANCATELGHRQAAMTGFAESFFTSGRDSPLSLGGYPPLQLAGALLEPPAH